MVAKPRRATRTIVENFVMCKCLNLCSYKRAWSGWEAGDRSTCKKMRKHQPKVYINYGSCCHLQCLIRICKVGYTPKICQESLCHLVPVVSTRVRPGCPQQPIMSGNLGAVAKDLMGRPQQSNMTYK
jgi:hypothetical protein